MKKEELRPNIVDISRNLVSGVVKILREILDLAAEENYSCTTINGAEVSVNLFEGMFTITGRKVSIGECVQCNRKRLMSVTDNKSRM